jgi:hypothetical protein
VRKWFKRFKNKWSNLSYRVRRWTLTILAYLGLAVGLVVAAQVQFTYTAPTQYQDGSALPLGDIAVTRLYCNNIKVDEETGSDGDFDVLLAPGSYSCYATVVAVNGLESLPSNVVQRVVLSDQVPNAPVLDE